jgi:hypothetical protein
MTGLLLDHPWPLDQTLDARSEGFRVLEHFDELGRRLGIRAVPFIEKREYDEAIGRITQQGRITGQAYATLRRFAAHLVRPAVGPNLATPEPEPIRLTPCWKSALSESLNQAAQWWTPQIIIPQCRRAQWPPGDEVSIRVNADPQSQREQRVIVVLERYAEHPFARIDLNPWDLQRCHPPSPSGRANQHPCYLPKPPSLNGLDMSNIQPELAELRRRGWAIAGARYYLPPEGWLPENVDRNIWRRGRPFPEKPGSRWRRPRPVDHELREWVWDYGERHWDVQTRPYQRISHNGRRLGIPR